MWRSGVSLASRSLTGTGLVSLPLRDVRPLAPWTAEPILSGMFLRYYLELPMPFEPAERALIEIPGSGLGALIEETGDQAERPDRRVTETSGLPAYPFGAAGNEAG